MSVRIRLMLKWLWLFSAVLLLYSAVQEFYTRSYLKGFAEAIVPANGSAEHKAESILNWMTNPPNSRSLDGQNPSVLDSRDPLETLNNTKLLEVCGTSVNGYLNLARMVGLQVRPLILFGRDTTLAVHVVAETRVGDRWIVVDPAFRRMMRDASGRLLTKQDLRDPTLLGQATVGLTKYRPIYTYEHTTIVRLEALPYFGALLRSVLDSAYPQWEESLGSISWIFGRRSMILVLIASIWLALFTPAFVVFGRIVRSTARDRATAITMRIVDEVAPGRSLANRASND
jgi:hypothetical protein